MKIVHVLRAAVGGLFRHVLDLSEGQIRRGHEVGLILDANTLTSQSRSDLARLESGLALGVSTFAMSRQPGPGDALALYRIGARLRELRPDIVHGHGAKGGAFARLANTPSAKIRAYTPHGGSLHGGLAGLYVVLEKALARRGNLYLFESAFSEAVFRRKVGCPNGLSRVVHNGLSATDFGPIDLEPDATDLVFLGELRHLKGVDVLIDAIAGLHRNGRWVTATIVGDGPQSQAFKLQVQALGLSKAVRFRNAMDRRTAFALGRVVVVPSRAESLPYVVLEAAAAGKPCIATNVGGIPEIFGPLQSELVSPNNVAALSTAIADMIDNSNTVPYRAQQLRARVAESFTVETMVDGIMSAYSEALAANGIVYPDSHRERTIFAEARKLPAA
jgi:glycosyltransferase involved in cell wall biosynthesis